MTELMIPIPRIPLPAAERKRLGAFYTPEKLSQILTDWAIRASSDLILEPSFGGCGFLVAARRRLTQLGANDPKAQIYGCDIDNGAFEFLAEALGRPVDQSKFLHKDFLETQALIDWPVLFDATIGNPPYIPYQSIPEAKRKGLVKNAESLGVALGGKSSLWAHFLFHAVSFVAPNGRMAWVLPGSFLQADYAVNVRQYLARSFSDVMCILMHQRFFKAEGTEEETVVLLAKGRGDHASESSLKFYDALDLSELETTIVDWELGKSVGRPLIGRPSLLSVSGRITRVYSELESNETCLYLGDLLKINIGLVTGANKFFVIDQASKVEARLADDDVLPVLSKFKFAQGLSFSLSDFESLIDDGGRGYLVSSEEPPVEGSGLFEYLQSFSVEERGKVSTFKKREIWHSPSDGKIPDGFFPVMNHHGPRLVLNNLGVNCTNTIHRAYFQDGLSEHKKKLIAISLLTSFSQISSEFVGRRYGSGVLKHEPREAEKIALMLPDGISHDVIDNYYSQIDILLRHGKHDEASAKADEVIFGSLPQGNYKADMLALALCKVRELRKNNRYRSGV
ncbi:adenine-specific DNA-methyltransferase [Pseudomonas chlororaphis]|uniref:HsdM family class I SAM-dependent methyltransferase n=1 Tax=Pseudomonas chlororaphis TaxID=587753 RepID=UPI0039E0860A